MRRRTKEQGRHSAQQLSTAAPLMLSAEFQGRFFLGHLQWRSNFYNPDVSSMYKYRYIAPPPILPPVYSIVYTPRVSIASPPGTRLPLP